jgi:O-methyltransferase involved in polyketide biosynthesis
MKASIVLAFYCCYISLLPYEGRHAVAAFSVSSGIIRSKQSSRLGTSFRGSRYQSTNSTIPTAAEAAQKVGVEPTLNVSKKMWKRAWNIHRAAMPRFLHRFDRLEPPDSKLSLMCLWWKALAANNPQSPVFDERLHYDLLPPFTRRVIEPRLLRRLYPRLHHSNVEIRTSFLDRCIETIAQSYAGTATKVRLVSFGSGYDLRSIKLRERGTIDEAIELDLPNVIESKSKLFSQRLQKRRKWLTNDLLPKMYKVDLHEVDQVEAILREVLVDEGWHTIFVFEGVMIYLNEGVPTALLKACRNAVPNGDATLCFADMLENIPGGDMEVGKRVLAETGWTIVEWQPKPGLARHMGMAEPLVV